MAQRDTQFSYFRVTNGHMLFSGEEKAKKLGCTGEIEVESEIRTVTKKCEGIDTEKRTQVTGQKIKFVGHIEREVLNGIFGIDTKGLKTGVYAYGKDSIGKTGCLTFDLYDLMETDTELLAFPKVSVTSGLTLKIKNGEDEVQEIELEFSATPDEYGKVMYTAFKSDATEVSANWHTKFESKNMQQGL